jgi:uncharacterized protein (TIGR03435 family)
MRAALRTIAVAVSLAVAADAQAPAAAPAFDVVSIKPSEPETGPNRTANIVTQRPDGGLIAVRTPVSSLIARAYPGTSAPDTVGFPDWARRQFWDISATASLTAPTTEQRAAMLRSMLADRFGLLAHTERRTLPTYDLVLDRKDGRLGPGLAASDVDCDAINAARRAAYATGQPLPPVDPDKPPPCVVAGSVDAIRGEAAISVLTQMLSAPAGRQVVDKTGLRGAYRITLKYELANVALGAVAPPENAVSVFTAVREQLGLRLEPSRTERDVLVIDRLERPTEN